ncbi:MAG: MFS transporter [Lachnospiraceae bacterium]|nr:MFS transporter [Lachnospiraceae bacterium]
MSVYKTSRSLNIKFGIVQGLMYACMGSFGGFIVALGLAKGYSQSSVSLALSLNMICTIAGNLFFGSLADRFDKNKQIFVFCMALSAVAQAGMVMSSFFPVYVLFYAMLGFFMGPVGALLDTWVLRGINFDIKTYGRIRSMGALGYGVMMLVAGILVNRYGYFTAMVVSDTLCITDLLFAAFLVKNITRAELFLADPSRKPETVSTASKHSNPIKELTKSGAYIGWVIMIFLIGLSMAPINSMKIVIMESVGGDVSSLGIDGFLGCSVQFVLLCASGLIAGISTKKREVIIAAMTGVSVVLCMFANSTIMVYGASIILYGLFSFVNPTTREIVKDNISYEHQTVAIGIADLSYGNISTVVAMLYAGTVSERFGLHTMIMMCFITVLVPIALALLSVLKDQIDNKHKHCCQTV